MMLLLGLSDAAAVAEEGGETEEGGTKARVASASRRMQHVVCKNLIFEIGQEWQDSLSKARKETIGKPVHDKISVLHSFLVPCCRGPEMEWGG